MVKVLDIIIDRRPEGRPRKMENQTIEKIGCAPIFPSIMFYIINMKGKKNGRKNCLFRKTR